MPEREIKKEYPMFPLHITNPLVFWFSTALIAALALIIFWQPATALAFQYAYFVRLALVLVAGAALLVWRDGLRKSSMRNPAPGFVSPILIVFGLMHVTDFEMPFAESFPLLALEWGIAALLLIILFGIGVRTRSPA